MHKTMLCISWLCVFGAEVIVFSFLIREDAERLRVARAYRCLFVVIGVSVSIVCCVDSAPFLSFSTCIVSGGSVGGHRSC